MKKILIAAAALLMMAGFSTSCKRGELKGFKQTQDGLNYKFHVKTKNPLAQENDIIVAEYWTYDELEAYKKGESQYTNAGSPEPILQVMEAQYPGDMMDAFKMVRKGDSVTFAFCLETMSKHNPGMPMDPNNKYMIYTFKIHGVYTEEEFELKMMEDQIVGETEEAEKLEAYVTEKGITVKPNDDGVYVIVRTKGNGAVAAKGKRAHVNYVGTLLDGTLFDTSIEKVAQEHDAWNPQRQYIPLAYTVGVGEMIRGWDNAVEGMRVGTKATLIIPSNMAYGAQGRGSILPFSTLIFDIDVVNVE
jgi:FKBP-type peptidyl-prolyl cis-trans isomerase